MYWQCSVPKCSSKRQDVKLHIFPFCKTRSKKWLDSINCDNLRALSFSKLCRRYVCHRHFENRFVTAKGNLLAVAYPTLFSEEEMCNGKSSQLENTENHAQDHNYSRKRKHSDHSYAKPLEENVQNVHNIPKTNLTDFTSHPQPSFSTTGLPQRKSSILCTGMS